MGVETVALVIGGVTAAASAGAAYDSAQRQNKAARRAADSTRAAANENAAQVRQAESIEAQRQRSQSARVRAMLRVRAAEQGASIDDGSFADLDRQNAIDAQINRNITRMNAGAQERAIVTGAQAHLEGLRSNQRNALLEAFLGGAQGAGTGLSIASSYNTLSRGAG